MGRLVCVCAVLAGRGVRFEGVSAGRQKWLSGAQNGFILIAAFFSVVGGGGCIGIIYYLCAVRGWRTAMPLRAFPSRFAALRGWRTGDGMGVYVACVRDFPYVFFSFNDYIYMCVSRGWDFPAGQNV